MNSYMLNGCGRDSRQNDIAASHSFVDKFINGGFGETVKLNICSLYDALYSLYLVENQNKFLMLYLHNERTSFSHSFCNFISEPILQDILENNFLILGWDIGNGLYTNILIETLKSVYALLPCIEKVENNTPCIIFVKLLEMDFHICSIMDYETSFEDFKMTIKEMIDCFGQTEQISSADPHMEELGFKNFQQKMFNLMGNRDYDEFKPTELDLLKEKIGFALFGSNSNEYKEKERNEMDEMFKLILENNNEFSAVKNKICLMVVYNCLTPLKQPDDNFNAVPVFIIRKCLESNNPCRIIIDHTKRVYRSWDSYLKFNKYPKCLMVVPKEGRYEADENGRIKLQYINSPACSTGEVVLQAMDVSSTAVGIVATSTIVAAAIPAITIAPVILAGAAISGVTVGLWSAGRSIYNLIDRKTHKESMSVSDPQARAAFLNLAAAGTGLLGAGSTAVLSSMVAGGSTIGTTTRAAINTVQVANIGVSGVAVGNSVADVFRKYFIDEEVPSTLTIVQLSASVLFFGHAVCNFKTAGMIIEESQTNVLQRYADSLRSNRHRKAFNKLQLETIRLNDGNIQTGRAEVISTVLKIRNRDETFAFLVRSNKKLNDMGVRFSAKDGLLSFNGYRMNVNDVSAMSLSEVGNFFGDLPHTSSSSFPELPVSYLDNSTSFNMKWITRSVAAMQILIPTRSLREKITLIVDQFLELLNDPDSSISQWFRSHIVVRRRIPLMILSAIEQLSERLSHVIHSDPDNPIFKYINTDSNVKTKLISAHNVCNRILVALRYGDVSVITEFMQCCTRWMVSQLIRDENAIQTSCEPHETNKIKKTCEICTGIHYI